MENMACMHVQCYLWKITVSSLNIDLIFFFFFLSAAIFRTAVSLPSINIYLFFLLLYEQIQEVEFHQLFVSIRTSSHFPL